MTDLPLIRISVAGPTGVGKTTIIATIMRDTTKALPAPFRVKPATQADEDRIKIFNQELEEAIIAGDFTFNPKALAGTSAITLYNYQIEYKDMLKQPFSIMDVPGGWLRGSRPDDQWKRYEEHLQQSIVLWVPIEAPLLMEAKTPNEKKKMMEFIMTTDVREVVEMWAKYRMVDEYKDLPAVICFAPMKCETYFSKADNPKKPEEFFQAFQREYKVILDTVRETCPRCEILYAPIESIGCVRLQSMDWHIASANEPPAIAYTVVEPYHQEIAGVEVLMDPVYHRGATQCGALLELKRNQVDEEHWQKRDEYDNRGPLTQFGDFIFGKGKKKRAEIQDLAEQSMDLTEEIEKLRGVLETLAVRPSKYSKKL